MMEWLIYQEDIKSSIYMYLPTQMQNTKAKHDGTKNRNR